MKTIGSTTTVYIYDAQGSLTAEYGGSNSASGTQYLTTDHLGETRGKPGTVHSNTII